MREKSLSKTAADICELMLVASHYAATVIIMNDIEEVEQEQGGLIIILFPRVLERYSVDEFRDILMKFGCNYALKLVVNMCFLCPLLG